MPSSIRYYEVRGAGGRVFANFLERSSADEYVLKIQQEHKDDIEHKTRTGLIITDGERRGEMNYAVYGISVAETTIRFSDED